MNKIRPEARGGRIGGSLHSKWLDEKSPNYFNAMEPSNVHRKEKKREACELSVDEGDANTGGSLLKKKTEHV